MKKYLLLFLMCVYASIGAWAVSGSFGTNSTWEVDGGTIKVTVNTSGDINSACNNYEIWDYGNKMPAEISAAKTNGFTTLKIVTGTGVAMSIADGQALYCFGSNYKVLDLSEASVTLDNGVCKLGGGSDNHCQPNIIVPSAYSSDPSSFSVAGQYGASFNNNRYAISGTTLKAAFGDLTNAEISTVKGSCTTLEVYNFSNGDLSSCGFTTIDFTNTTLTGDTNVPTGATVYVNTAAEKDYIKGTNVNVQARFNGTATVAAGGSLGTNITSALSGYEVNNNLSNITTLNITGQLTEADVEWLNTNKSNLSGLTTVNLTGLSGLGSGVSKSTIAAALPTGVTVNYPALFYSSAGGVSTFTVLEEGEVTEAALTSVNVPASVSDATIKIIGNVTSSDITNILAHANNGWATKKVDLSEATLNGSMPRLSGTPDCLEAYYIILPPGTSAPTDAQIAFTSNNEHASTNGIYNGYGTLRYIVIPASENGGHAKVFINNDINGNIPTELQTNDISLIANINNPSVIDVYNLNDAFSHASYSTLQTNLNALTATDAAWEGKSIVYHATMNPMVITGCNVTIDMNEANGESLATLISEAKIEVVKTIPTGICSLTINGPLASADIAALNTAMGNEGDLASIESLNLGGATGMSQTNVDALAIPETLTRLTIPANRIVDGALKTTLATSEFNGLTYVYSPSSDSQKPGKDQESLFDRTKNLVADYVWVNRQEALPTAFTNEEQLRNSYNIKVASSVELTATDVDFDGLGDDYKPSNYLFLNFSDANLTPAVAASYKVTDDLGYRIILPNNWTGDQMAVFAANPHCGNLAAVYSYNGTKLNIMEINDGAYSPAALADPRIMRSGTTEVDVVSGYYDGNTYAQFGTNLLAALNNMGKDSFTYNSENYTNTLGQSVKTISIETTSAAPYVLTFDNPSITTLNVKGLVQANADLNVNACSALTTLDLTSSSIKSVTANNTHITSADFTSTAISGATDFSGATALATLTTTDETTFNGALNLSQTAFTSFTSAARHGGDISFNQCPNLASINVTAADFANTTSKIHIDADAENGENTTILSTLTANECIQIPSTFDKNRLHPTPNDALVKQAPAVVDAVTYTATDMTFHDNNTNDAYYPTYRYWYQGTTDNEGIATLGTSNDRRLATIINNNATLTNNSHAKIKIVGPLTSEDIDALDDLNCTMLDISEVTIETGLLKTKLTAGDILNANTKFLVLPDSCSREHIVNGTTLANLANVYSVIAVQNTEDGRDLTSWSRVAGALQPAVVGALNNNPYSWSLTPSGQATRNIYTSSVSNFKALKISGCINSYDLSKADQKLNEGGHLSWAENAVEAVSQTRTQNGAYTVYGPFSACFLLTEIDLKNAYFEPWSNQQTGEGYFTRYWVSDMTLSALNVISTATYKVVIPQDSRVNEVPADFLRCSTNIRAICIPSNIRVIRTRAFYTIDYVWTTSASGLGMEGSDPEGSNTRLDNGASLSVDGGTTFVETSALVYNKQTHKYEENPAFLDSYYTANYGTENGGGTYTFGSNLRLIETGAFANTQPNVKDVYVLNTTAPECHVDAFNTVMYTGNGGYNSAKVSDEGIITRDAYYNGRWITMLHYPRQTTTPNVQRYTDPTREYSIATGERDGKGAILYFPNQSEFIRAYQQGTYGYIWNAWNPTREYGSVDNGTLTNTTSSWNAENQSTANELFDAYTTGGTNHQYTSFAGVNDSTSVTKTTTTLVPYYQVQYGSGSYSTETQGNLYPKSEILAGRDVDNSGEPTAKDYRGWHQFVLNAYAANTVLEEEPYRSYITDNEWWTIVPEFDITRSESALFFGRYPGVTTTGQISYPKIHKLRYVRREYSGETIYLNFTQDLATQREDRTNRKGIFTRADGESGEITAYTNADQHGAVDSETGILKVLSNIPAGDDVVMSAGVPYLIKPDLPANGQRQYRIFKSTTDAASYNNNKAQNDPVGIGLETLYAKIKFAQEMSGEDQRALVKSGTYTVPVFVSVADGEGVVKEAVEMDGSTQKIFRPDDEVTSAVEYYRSADRHYTFVGTLYKSFLPHYCYFLGWDSANNCAKFYYHNGNFETIDNEMRWANGTGVIVPVLAEDLSEGKFNYDVEEAKDMANPAQWDLLTKFADDSFKHTGGGTAKQYVMDFNAPDMIAVDDSEVTGIANVDATDNVVINGSADVYTVNGQKVGTSLEGLPKGIYIVNGKKFIVK